MPHSMIVNSDNELFIFGTTGSSDFPTTTNAFQKTFAGGNPINPPIGVSFPTEQIYLFLDWMLMEEYY